eukprot:9371276-Ditylum_brightwellii.AAC.1
MRKSRWERTSSRQRYLDSKNDDSTGDDTSATTWELSTTGEIGGSQEANTAVNSIQQKQIIVQL